MSVNLLTGLLSTSQRKRSAGERPGAIVIGGDYQGLGIVRSLGRRGVPVCVVDDEVSISRFSRYSTFGIRVPNLRDADRAVETLLELGHRYNLNGWVLFPTRDEVVAFLSLHRSALARFFRVPTPHWDSIRPTWNKWFTYQLANELDIPIPKTWCPQKAGDMDEITVPFPVALKPAIKEHFFYATKAKAWRVNTRVELQRLLPRATAITGLGGVLIQDLIPGNGDNQFSYCAFFKNGNAVTSMVTQRLRQHPHEFGRASTYVKTIQLPTLETLSERFLRAINYYGLVEMEYKRDPRDGQFKLLDVNARTWGYHTLGSCAGIDFPYVLYADQLGQRIESCRARVGVSWIRLLTDIPTGIIEICQGRLSWPAYLQSLRVINSEAVFSTEDPLPGIIECALLPYLMMKRGF
jgi:D-aspartate ligase